MVVVNRKTAAYYYRLHEIIAYELSQETDEFLSGEIELMSPTLVVIVKENVVKVQ